MTSTAAKETKSSVENTVSVELTLDDIHSYVARLQDTEFSASTAKLRRFSNSNSTDGLMGSTDGMMGSTDSFADSFSESVEGGGGRVQYATLRADLLRSDLGCSVKTVGESQGDIEWEYPDMDVHSNVVAKPRSFAQSRSQSPKRRGSRRLRNVRDNSTRAMYGDDKDLESPRIPLVTQNSTRAILGDDKDSDYQR